MKRCAGIAAIIIVVLGLVAIVGTRALPTERVYAVADVQRGLARAPRQWIGRTILIRGVLVYATSDPGPIDPFHPPANILVTYALYQPAPQRPGEFVGLPLTLRLAPHLAAARRNALVALLSRVPVLAQLLTRTAPSVFRVTLLPPHQGVCPMQDCPVGQIDEQPQSLRWGGEQYGQ